MWVQGLNSVQQSELRSRISTEESYFLFIYYFLHEYLLGFITVGHFNIGSRELRKSFHIFFSGAKLTELAETTSSSNDQYVNESSNFKACQNALVGEPTPMHTQVAPSECSGLKKKKAREVESGSGERDGG